MASNLSFVAALCAAVTACGGGRYTRIEDLPAQKAPDAEYRIVVGDVHNVRVWNQDAMSLERAVVRDDGKISMPFLQDVEAAGHSPTELAARVQTKLNPFVVNPVVNVAVVERRPVRISVLGEVMRPGVYDVDRGAGLLAALAAAGGLTTYAYKDRAFLLRAGPAAEANAAPVRIRFQYEALVRGEPPAATFRLQSGDVLTVE